MANNRHKNRIALIVRLDKAAEDSAFVGDGLEGMILSVDWYIRDPDQTGNHDFYGGEILHLPETAISPYKRKLGVRGSYTVLFSRAFKEGEKHIGRWSYGDNRL